MFDLISGPPRHPFHDPTATPTIISVLGHGVVILAFAGASFMAAGELPEVPDMMAFVMATAAPPPPPPPPPPAPRATAAAKPQPTSPAGAAAPLVEAPSTIAPEPAMPSDLDMEGVEGGIEGGIAGGVLGGVLGGLIEAPPPPLPPPPPAAVPLRAPVRIGGQLAAPALLRKVDPTYPEVAVRARVAGVVILEAMVDAEGNVESVRVLRSIKLLDYAAIEAVKQWKYSPLLLNGTASPFILTVTLSFSVADT